jgi:hypothetical protein
VNKILSFEKARENACTVEMETIECEECGCEFHREVNTDYSICSKKCLDDAIFASRGEE